MTRNSTKATIRNWKAICRKLPYFHSTSLPVGSAPRLTARSEKFTSADDLAERRHDDVFDQRSDDLAERRADDHADCQVDDVALHCKFFEFFPETHGITPVLWEAASLRQWNAPTQSRRQLSETAGDAELIPRAGVSTGELRAGERGTPVRLEVETVAQLVLA